MTSPGIQILDSCAIIRLNALFPKYLLAKDIKIGESDQFSFLGKLNGNWHLYRRHEKSLSGNEKAALVDYARKSGLKTFDLHDKIMSVSMNDEMSSFIDGINAITGCRLSPVLLQTQGDVYLCIEFDMSHSRDVSNAVLGFLAAGSRSDASLIYYGRYTGKIPYLLRMYLEKGNSPSNLTLVETRWEFMDDRIDIENEGLFMNTGTIIPKEFSDSSSETIVMRLDSPEVKGSMHVTHLYPESEIVEILLKSGYFHDFFLNVILEYSGPIFYTSHCDGKGLTNNFIIDTSAKDSFLFGLFENWSKERRVKHVNLITQVRTLQFPDPEEYAVAHP